MMEKEKYTPGQILTFDIYGDEVKGTFVSINDKGVIRIRTMKDLIFDEGTPQEIHESHLKQ